MNYLLGLGGKGNYEAPFELFFKGGILEHRSEISDEQIRDKAGERLPIATAVS